MLYNGFFADVSYILKDLHVAMFVFFTASAKTRSISGYID